MAFRTNKTPVLQEKSASGSVASFNTALAMPLVNGEFSIEAYQEGSGDPSPVNVRPIHGFDKVNLVNSRIVSTNKLIPITATQEGSGEPSPTNIRPIHAGLTIVRDDDSVLEVYGGELDVLTGVLTLNKWCVQAKDLRTNYINWVYYSALNGVYFPFDNGTYRFVDISISETYPDGKHPVMCNVYRYPTAPVEPTDENYIRWLGSPNNGNLLFKNEHTTSYSDWVNYIDNADIQLVFDIHEQTIQLSPTELARAKEALGINTYTIQLGQDFYGGTYNSVSGKLTITWIKPNFNNLNFTKTQSGLFQTLSLCDVIKRTPSSYIPSQYIKSSVFFAVTSSSITGPQGGTPSPNGAMASNSSGAVYFNYLGTTDIDEFKNYMSDKDFIIELAEPIEIDIGATPISTNIGNNTIFADTGDIDLTYKDLDIAKRGNFREVFKLPS